MLLNQGDIARAIECIQTAQEVLSNDLQGVNCFRHLGNQLEEMTRMIGKMLLEEFEAVIQREFAWPFEEKTAIALEEEVGHLLILAVRKLQTGILLNRNCAFQVSMGKYFSRFDLFYGCTSICGLQISYSFQFYFFAKLETEC